MGRARNREIAALDALLVDLARNQGITIVLVEHVGDLIPRTVQDFDYDTTVGLITPHSRAT